jgi:antitoxin (DNA-binding transcriptional repressor) of toxin-antitoxin stability system
MRTVSVRELKSNPSGALRDAREGPVLVLNRGLPEALLVSVAAGEGSGSLELDVAEAVAVIRGLAERRGARAVRAVDRATPRRVAEPRSAYGDAGADVSLATLAATLQVIAAPRRISRRAGAAVGEPETIVVELDRAPARSEASRLEAAATAVGRRIEIRVADADAGEPDGELVFDRAHVPMRVIDRLIAEGLARPAIRRGPFPPPAVVPPGVSATAEVLRERDGDPR